MNFAGRHVHPVRANGGARGGFTLFEIVLVMLILGIAAAIVVPAAANASSPRLRTAANVLASDIEFCSSECIAQPSSPRGVSFDQVNNKYSLIDFNAGTIINYPADGKAYTNDFSTGRNAQLKGITLGNISVGGTPLTTLTFDAYGKPLITGDLVINLTSGGTTMTVTVKQNTGDVIIGGG